MYYIKIINLTIKINSATKELKNKRSNELYCYKLSVLIENIKNNIKKMEDELMQLKEKRYYMNIELAKLMYNPILTNKFWECNHLYEVIMTSNAGKQVQVLSKCIKCNENEILHIHNNFNSYEELMNYLNNNDKGDIYYGGTSYINLKENKDNSSSYTLK